MVRLITNTRRLDALRNVLKNKTSYLSVMLIAFLGVTAFLSMEYAAFSLRRAGSDAYNEMNFRDIEVVSPLMLGEEDFEAIKNTEGIKDAEPVYYAAANLVASKAHKSVNVISLTERINRAEVLDGRKPEKPGECAVEKRLAEELGLSLGDSIKLLDSDGSENRYFSQSEYLISGIMMHPNHTNPSSAEAGYVMVTGEAFDTEALDGSIMAVDAVIDKEADAYRFGKDYESAVSSVIERLEPLAKERYKKRCDSLIDKLSENSSEYIRLAEEENLIPKGLTEGEIILLLGDRIKALESSSWIINDVKGNTDYASLVIDGENISKLEMTFSLMFIFVGALVIYATIGKMIEEQREQVGGMKAFGLLDREIIYKYLVFGNSAALFGMIFGILASRFIFSGYVLHNYQSYYTFDIEKPRISIVSSIVVLLVGVMISVAACLLACKKLLRLSAFSLLRPRVPKLKPETGEEKVSVRSLYGRLIFRNMRTDKKRIAVTVASICGCCALIVTGFTMRSAVGKCLDKQYSEITLFDEKVKFNTQGAGEEIERILKERGVTFMPVFETYITYRMGKNTPGRLLCGNPEELGDYLNIRDWKNRKKLSLSEEGIYIPRRIAEVYHLRRGDEVEITSSDFQTGKVKVAGIFENYIGSDVLMNTETYGKLFLGTSEPNEYLLKLEGADEKELVSVLNEVDGFEKSEHADAERSMFESATSVINAVILLFVFLAALMAGVVLTNLTNMYMLQKKRELTIMRINGFTVSETIGYMIRETFLTTAIGIVLGLATGSVSAYYIIRSLEQPYTRMDRSVSFTAWIIAVVITIVFTALVNFAVLRKVKKLRLSDI